MTAVYLVAQYARYEIRRMEAVSNFSFLYISDIIFSQIFIFVILSLFILGLLIDISFFHSSLHSQYFLLCMEFTSKKLRILMVNTDSLSNSIVKKPAYNIFSGMLLMI